MNTNKKNAKNNDWTTLAILCMAIAGLLLLFSCLAPILFTNYYSFWDFTETGQIGDTIGGIMNPFIAIGGVFMTFLAFYMQIRANKIQREQFQNTLKKNIVDEKVDCYYKLKLLKLDIERIIKDIDSRTDNIQAFIKQEDDILLKTNTLKRSLLNHYDRVLRIDRLSVYKGFEIFLNDDKEWINKFYNLFSILDYLPSAFKKIYIIVDKHIMEVSNIKNAIRRDLIKFDKECVSLHNNAKGVSLNNNKDLDNVIRGYRAELMRSSEEKTEVNFSNITNVLADFIENVGRYTETFGYHPNLDNLSSFAARILINLNSIKEKSNQIVIELNSFINRLIGEKHDLIKNKLKDISVLINSSLEIITVEKIQEEYGYIPN